jgi:signal transduction histidine kinase
MLINKFSFILILLFFWLSSCNEQTTIGIECREGSPTEKLETLEKSTFPLYFKDGSFNPGYTAAYWWIKILVYNTGKAATKYILLNNPQINHLTVIDPANPITLHMGDKMVFNKRSINFSDFVIPIQLAEKEKRTIYIGIDKIGESLQLKAELSDYENLSKLINQKMLTIGLIMGWMILIIIIIMLIWMYSKESANLFYSLYILTITIWILANLGIGFQLFWPSFPNFNNIARPFLLFIAACFFALTLLSYFKENPSTRLTRKILKIETIIAAALLIILTTVDVDKIPTSIKFQFLVIVPIFIGLFVLTAFLYIFLNWKTAVRFSGFYFFGMLFFLIISFCQNIFQYGLTNPVLEFINIHGGSISLIGETSIIATSFIYKFNAFKKEKEIRETELLAQQFALSKEIIDIQELERKRIGQDIHDSIGGLLATLKIYLEKLSIENINTHLEKSRNIADQCMHEIRTVIDNLVPQNIHLHGLCRAFELFIAYCKESSAAKTIFYHQIFSELTISSQIVIYRILTELLNNSNKHANASEINISVIEENNELRILFEDNGKGFNPVLETTGHGLKNISNRVKFLHGLMHVESSHQGTTIIIHIPLKAHLKSAANHENKDYSY